MRGAMAVGLRDGGNEMFAHPVVGGEDVVDGAREGGLLGEAVGDVDGCCVGAEGEGC